MSNEFLIQEKYMPLSEVDVGHSCQIVRPSGEVARRLAELGLTAGATITVLRTAPLGDPLEIAVRGYRLCLRRTTARDIAVKACTSTI